MGTIHVEKVERGTNKDVAVTIEITTDELRMSYPMVFADQGSMADNEKRAYSMLLKVLEDSLNLVRPLAAYRPAKKARPSHRRRPAVIALPYSGGSYHSILMV